PDVPAAIQTEAEPRQKSGFVNPPDGRATPSTAGSACVPGGSDEPGDDVLGEGRSGGCDRGLGVAVEQLVAMQVAAANAAATRVRAIDPPPRKKTHQILVAAGLGTISIRRHLEGNFPRGGS